MQELGAAGAWIGEQVVWDEAGQLDKEQELRLDAGGYGEP